jgi:TolA-binding protein
MGCAIARVGEGARMTAFDKLGRDVATALKPGPGQRRARQLTALLAVDFERRRGMRRALAIAAVVTTALAVALLSMKGLKNPWADDRALEVAGEPALDEGRWLQVADDRPLKLVFGDGTEFRLERQSRGRLSLASRSEARLTLESGELRAWVQPAAATGRAWSFIAGPYQVQVIGTELHIGWNAELNRARVHVAHGQARVRGGPLERAGLLLGSGDHLEVQHGRIELQRGTESVRDTAAAPRPASAPEEGLTYRTPGEIVQEPESVARDDDLAKNAGGSNGPSTKEQDGGALPSAAGNWKALAHAGDYREALLDAEREGFDALAERLNAADLALLADAARLAGDSARARQALLTLRRRFPSVAAAHTGAFRLGRMALADRNYAEAAKWFEAYLQAAPAGTLASEATGRLLEARARAGDRSGAEAAARDYLRRFPGGPYDSVARALLRGDNLAPR